MIAEVLKFVRQILDARLRLVQDGADDSGSDRVVFIDGDGGDVTSFKSGAVTLLLIKLEEDRELRAADPYLRRGDDGRALRVQPDIRLNLHLLFVASFKFYDVAWSQLSALIQYLQTVRVFDADSTPGLPDGVERLVFELSTLSLAEQNEVWSALRTAHHPSVLYRVRLITYRDQSSAEVPEIGTIETTVRRMR